MTAPPDGVRLSAEEFRAAFPFHLAFDRELRLVSKGTSLGRLLGDAPRATFPDVAQIVRPRLPLDFAEIEARTDQLFILSVKTEGIEPLQLRGQMIRLRDQPLMVFLGSPWLRTSATMKEFGLTLTDFALHDSTVDMVHVLRSQVMALEETRALASKLEQANLTLKEQYSAVERAEAQIRTIISSAVDAIITIDEAGIVRQFNPAAERIFGYAAEEIVGRNVSTLMPQPFKAAHDSYLRRYRETGQASIIGVGREVPAVRKDGTEFPCDLSVAEARFGDSVQFVGILRDISDRKEAERSLVETTSRLSTLIRNLNAGALVEDERRRIVLVNETFCRLFGIAVPPELLVGADCSDAANQTRHFFSDPDGFASGIERLLALKTPSHGERLDLADGRVFSRDFIPIFVDQQYCGNLWLYEDVSDQKRAEEAILSSEARKTAILQTALDAIITIDESGNVLEWNPSAETIFGWKKEDVIGRELAGLILPEEYVEPHRMGMARMRDGGAARVMGQRLTMSARRADGEVFPCELAINEIQGPGGRVFTSFLRDISDRAEALAKLNEAKELAERSDRAKTNFLSMMSHEIRTPLNAILGMSELMRDSALSRAQTGYLASIESSAEALLTLVNDFLDLTKIEAGQFDLQFAPFSTRTLVEDVERILRGRAAPKGVALRAAVASGVPDHLIGDAARLRQILLNLGGNAIKFTERGEVSLVLDLVETAGSFVTVVAIVRDTGIGVPKEEQERIFDRFYQADQSISRRFGGSGLGLDISRALAFQMNGRIWLAWSEPGKGSEFRFEVRLEGLPSDLARRSTPQAPPRTLTGELGPLRPPMRILMAEDNPENREIMVRMLEASGYSVDCVGDGDAVLARYDRSVHDLILMDVEMPGSDGIAATAAIRAEERSVGAEPVPILMLTAHVLNDVRQQSLNAGANAFIGKPVRRADLIQAIEEWRNRRPAVLIVDDSAENREVFRRFVSSDGLYRACAAPGGEEALLLVDRWEFAAVLLDLEMPGLDGFTVAREIRSRVGPGIPVIALSGHDDEATVQRCLAGGFDHYLVKPVRRQVLIETLDGVLGSVRSADDSRIAVRIEADVADLAEGFLRKRRDEVERLAELLDRDDFNGIRRIGHNLKGSAGAYGFPQLGVMGAALEEGGRTSDRQRTLEQIEAIRDFLARVVLVD